MAYHDRDKGEGGADEYGPVTDLIFSLFSVAVLLLGIVGTDASVTRSTLTERLAQKDRDIVALEQERSKPQPQPRQQPPSPPAVTQPAQPDRSAEITALTDELAAQRRENDDLRSELSAREPSVYRRYEFPADIYPEPMGGSLLVGNSIDPLVLEQIRLGLGEALTSLADISANRIVLEIDIARTFKKARGEADPDYLESQRVAQAVTDALRQTPVPIACVIPMPFGKMRSAPVTQFTARPAMNAQLADFENVEIDPLHTLSNERLNQARTQDTGIRMVAEHVLTGPCASEDLIDGIVAWIEGDLQAATP